MGCVVSHARIAGLEEKEVRPWLIFAPLLWFVAIVLAVFGAIAGAWGVVACAVILGFLSIIVLLLQLGRANRERSK